MSRNRDDSGFVLTAVLHFISMNEPAGNAQQNADAAQCEDNCSLNKADELSFLVLMIFSEVLQDEPVDDGEDNARQTDGRHSCGIKLRRCH